MANNVNNVSAGKPKVGGAIYAGPVGTTAPADATTVLAAGFKCLGYANEDGLSNNNAPSVDTVKAWGGDIVLTIQNEKTDEFSFTLIEVLSEDVLKTIYGSSNVTSATNTITVSATNAELEAKAWVFEVVMRNGTMKRIYVPNATITSIGEVAYTDSDAVGYEITITAFPDANGVTHKEFIKLPTASA